MVAEEEVAAIGNAMAAFIRKDLKWTHRELHDALVTAGVSVPLVPSMRNAVAALNAQYGDSDAGFLPQSFQSYTTENLRDILRILSRTGTKLGGKLSDTKTILSERLAHWLDLVLQAGRAKPVSSSKDEISTTNASRTALDDAMCPL